ncbi:hypothetical protein ACHQM5_002114 [Ranunculus cassubicifolius]
MVGFNHAIKPTQQSCSSKLNNQTDPIQEPVEFQDLSLSLLDPLSTFDFVDDWILDNDSINMSIEDINSDLKIEDFVTVKEEISEFDSLIEEEMGKVSLVGDSEVSVRNDNDVSVKESVIRENKVVYDVLGELKVKEDVIDEENNGVDMANKSAGEEEVSVEKTAVIGEEDSSSSSEEEEESDSGSSSSSAASSSSSSSDEEEDMVDAVEVEEGEIKDFDPEEIFAGSDDDELVLKGPIKSKNEIEYLPPVPTVDVKLEPHHQTLPVGVVLSIMDAKVVIEGAEKHNPLNEGSILWITETRSPLGIVDEIFGPVKNPFYIVRFNSEDEVPSGLSQGTCVSFVADFVDHVLNDKNLYKKGYDASGENDEEIDEEIEFSDDEKEAEYRKSLKMKNKGGNDGKHNGNQEFVARKKVQNKGSWKNNNQSPTQSFAGQHTTQTSGTSNPSHAPSPVSATSSGCGNCACSGPPVQNLGPANVMTGPPQQQMVFQNGFPMPFQQQNPYPHMPQMMPNGFPSNMPFHQPFDPSQIMMPNVFVPFPQMAFPPTYGPGFNQGPFGMGPQGHNQQGMSNGPPNGMGLPVHNQQGIPHRPSGMGFPAHNQQGMPTGPPHIMGLPGHNQQGMSNGAPNVMGLPGHNQQGMSNRPPNGMGLPGHNQPGMSNGPPNGMGLPGHNQQGMSNGPSNEQSNEMQGNFPSHHQQSRGRGPSRGGRSYGRGGGRFSGRRGRQ